MGLQFNVALPTHALKGFMFTKLSVIAVSTVLLTGCAPTTPAVVGPSPAPSVSQSADGNDAKDSPGLQADPSTSSAAEVDFDRFLNSMEATCIYAQGVGVTESVSVDGKLEGSLILLPKTAAIADGYTAGWIPANGDPTEIVFNTDAFDSCYLANMASLAREAGEGLRDQVIVTYDETTDAYAVVVDFGDFPRSAIYQMGEGQIAYSVTGPNDKGQTISMVVRFGMPKAEQIASLSAAVDVLLGD